MIPEEYNKIGQDIEKVVQFSQELDFELPGTSRLMNKWRENKSRFYELFGDQLIWQSENKVTIALTTQMEEDFIKTFLDQCERMLPYSIFQDFSAWINENKVGFFKNRVVSALPDTDMRVNSKLLRSFRYLIEGEDLRKIQDLASQYIQKSKIEGYLCLSIHPLDYLTASENNSNWRSCHALDGEYRAGNLSYMLDPSTIVCYLRSANDVQLKRLPPGMLWNDKRWRMFLSIQKDNEICYLSKQYPFSSADLLRKVMDSTPIASLGFGEIHYDGFKTVKLEGEVTRMFEMDSNYFIYRHRSMIIDTRLVCAGEKGAMNYNDLIYSPSYTPVFAVGRRSELSYSADPDPVKRFKTAIGSAVPCLHCGKRFIDDSNTFLCEDCYDELIEGMIGYCKYCGEAIYWDDDIIKTPDGELVCMDCACELELEENDNG